jgi:hypothetical protein
MKLEQLNKEHDNQKAADNAGNCGALAGAVARLKDLSKRNA